jgi:hypothetical protein
MSPRSKKEYAEAILLRYKLTSRNQKTVILIEFRAACGYDRKHAIRVLRRLLRPIRIQYQKRGCKFYPHQKTLDKPRPLAYKKM